MSARAGSSMRLVRLRPHGPDPDRGKQTKFYGTHAEFEGAVYA